MEKIRRSFLFLFIAVCVAFEPCGAKCHLLEGNEKADAGICLICNELIEEFGIISSVQRVFNRAGFYTQPIHGMHQSFCGFLPGNHFAIQINLGAPLNISEMQFRTTSTVLRI
jgi:hypothetical protein